MKMSRIIYELYPHDGLIQEFENSKERERDHEVNTCFERFDYR
jgi:hypothetical protein